MKKVIRHSIHYPLYFFLMAMLLVIPIFSGSAPCFAAEDKYGGVLSMITVRIHYPIGWPAELAAAATIVFRPALEPLIWLDETGQPTLPRLATKWNYSPDGKTLTMQLRKDVKFHDGTNFNAAAVKWNIDQCLAAKVQEFSLVNSIDVVDDYTVQFNLSAYDNSFLSALCGPRAYMISPTAVEKNGVDWAKSNIVGTGPFKQSEFKRDMHIKFVKNEDYWQKGKPYLDGITILYITDQMTALASFKKGDGQFYLHCRAEEAAELVPMGYQFTMTYGNVRFLFPNADDGSIYQDRLVREAVEYAIDKKAIAEAVGQGYWRPANQPFSADMYAYNPDVKGREYNPEKAKQLLAQAGYPNGFDTTIILFGMIAREPGYIAIQQQLKKVGINAKIEKWDRGKWYKGKAEGWPKNTLFYGLTTRYPNLANTISSNFAGTGNYPSGHQPPEWTSMLTEAKTTMDFAQHKAILQNMMKSAVDSAMAVPLWEIGTVSVMAKNLKGHNWGKAGGDPQQWTPAEVYFSK